MSKQIFYDGLNLSLDRGTGVATYARSTTFTAHDIGLKVGILHGTPARPSRNELFREIAFFDSPQTPKLSGKFKILAQYALSPLGVTPFRVPVTGAVITKQFASRLPYFDEIYNSPHIFAVARRHFLSFKSMLPVRFRDPPSIFHWTYPLPLKSRASANIYTIHDLVPLRLPYTALDNKRFHFRLLREIVRRADHICTVSEHSRRDIIRYLNVPEDRVTNTYQAVHIPARYTEKTEDEIANEIAGVFGLPHKAYFLFYGSIEPKKNIGRMIEGYLAANIEMPLVIVGAQAWRSEEELRLLNDERIRYFARDNLKIIEKRIIHKFQYAPWPLLVSLIRGARAVLFPSLYEGFGLPVVESMRLGTPVITSVEASIPEIAGDAALLVDPYNATEIKRAVQAIANDTDLCAELSLKGLKRADYFSMERYRERLEGLYKKF
jgi:glycosyltransferase involved in cell wall biosynthesis